MNRHSAGKGARKGLSRNGPSAARAGDDHVCRHTTESVPHLGGEIVGSGPGTVRIGLRPAARVGDRCDCAGAGAELDVVTEGEPTVLIGGKPAVRRGDATIGGAVIEGDDTVRIGPPRGPSWLRRRANREGP
ncbi:MAG: PAAR domain-containing protein [Polyangiaceae bacterium]